MSKKKEEKLFGRINGFRVNIQIVEDRVEYKNRDDKAAFICEHAGQCEMGRNLEKISCIHAVSHEHRGKECGWSLCNPDGKLYNWDAKKCRCIKTSTHLRNKINNMSI